MRGITVFVAASAAFVSISFLGACSDSPMPSPSSPTPTSPSVPGPLPVFTVSGVAYEHTPAGIQPLAGLPLRVRGYRDLQTPVTVDVVTDAAGRYEVPGLVREYVLVGARPQDAYLSPCSVRLWLWNDDPKMYTSSPGHISWRRGHLDRCRPFRGSTAIQVFMCCPGSSPKELQTEFGLSLKRRSSTCTVTVNPAIQPVSQ